MGSHIVYAQLMKKKISMCGPIYATKRNISKFDINEDCPISKQKLLEEFEYKASEDYIKDNYSFLQKPSPLEGTFNYNWAFEQLGDNKEISLIEIKKILNLSLIGQIKNAFEYIKNI